MAKKFSWTKSYPVSADGLMEIMSGEEFEIRYIQSQPKNKEGTYTVVSRNDKKLVYRTDTVEWGKSITGSLDKSKTEKAKTTTTWDLTSRKAEWVYEGAHSQAKVYGSTEITPGKNQAVLSYELNVVISIPILGGKLEKIVISEVEKYWPDYEALVDEFVNKIQ